MTALEIIQLITNIFLIVGTIVAVIQLWLNRRIAQMDLERRKKEATISFTYEVLERVRELSEMIDDEYDDEPVKIEEYQASVEMQNTIRQYLDIMERIAVGINTGVYDFDIYCRICGTSTVMYWKQLSHVIEARRKELQRPEIYIEFESLANRVMESKRLAKNHKGDLKEKL